MLWVNTCSWLFIIKVLTSNLVNFTTVMKRVLSIIFVFLGLHANASHIIGGEITYDRLPGAPAGNTRYRVTLILFRDQACTNCAQLPDIGSIAVYNNDNGQRVGIVRSVGRTDYLYPIPIISQPGCLSNVPVFNYEAGYYSFEETLPNNNTGYSVSFQTCCRVSGIANAANQQGSTYFGEIPGENSLQGEFDNSARFETGISIICAGKPFILDFSATDPDGDQITYNYYDAYNGGAATQASFANPAPPPYGSISYTSGYNGDAPLGNATLDPNTGLITGIAPPVGKYIVAVEAITSRNGRIIARHKKDFMVTVADCNFASADLLPFKNKAFCGDDDLSIAFYNNNNSSLNETFTWDFGDPASGTTNTSLLANPTHLFSAPGVYLVKLIVNANTNCVGRDSALIRVFPGFYPAINPINPQCKNTPVQLIDGTTTNNGTVSNWQWNFGVTTTLADTSRIRNPTYIFPNAGQYNVTLIVGSSVGCKDTVTRTIEITDKPDFITTQDTLICTVDTLRLTTNVTTGSITWSPNYMINNVNSYNPLVSPDVPTTYTVSYTDLYGCNVQLPVRVDVATDVNINIQPNDTTICRTDSIRLRTNSNALYYQWLPNGLNEIQNPTIKSPLVYPTNAITNYSVVAKISNKCFSNATAVVRTVPYPLADVTGRSPICFGDSSQLFATGGSIYKWTPTRYLSNANINNPISIKPNETILYTVEVGDNLGCPKTTKDTFRVVVIKPFADAGPRDTSIVLGQPLQLNGAGGGSYSWAPSSFLNNANIQSPIATLNNSFTYYLTTTNQLGCKAYDTINVKFFFLPPDVYLPNIFTPNADNLNDVFRPIALGIRSLEGFTVFDRWGNTMFTTSQIGKGWDGNYKGTKQSSGSYVWQISATDYTGKRILRKGNFVLVR
jgi:gliding motility-associated-like protein